MRLSYGILFKSLFIIFLFSISLPPVASAKIISYKITDGFTVTSLPLWNNGYPFFNEMFYIPYQSGKMSLSRNPDGSGEMTVGDAIQVLTTSEVLTQRTVSSNCAVETPLQPTDITRFFRSGTNSIRIKLSSWCMRQKTISSLYIVNVIEDEPPTPSPTPPLSPTPAPFLELPWDYEKLGKTFDEVVYNPTSWFDHEYPLQNVPCCTMKIRKYTGEEMQDAYTSHSGYDYGIIHGIKLHTPVLAAASGIATFTPQEKSGGAGNVIRIDHQNGYQTVYAHLEHENLIVSTESAHKTVVQGEKIGQVGMTGNTTGPHIHFSVVNDANKNGSFTDDVQYGLVDPLGWEGSMIDPWEEWQQNDRTGTKSYSLFVKRNPGLKVVIPVSGGVTSHKNITVIIPESAKNESFELSVKDGPYESAASRKSVAPSFFLEARDALNRVVNTFEKPITIFYSYSQLPIMNIDENSLTFMYFNVQTNTWEVVPSVIDIVQKTVQAQTTHFSHFALMANAFPNIPPTTTHELSGTEGNSGWFRSDVRVTLLPHDSDLAYTLYAVDNGPWEEYSAPLFITAEGQHTIHYKSYDMGGNIEQEKKSTFTIDKQVPEATVFFDITVKQFVIKSDSRVYTQGKYITCTDEAGNRLELELDIDSHKRRYTLHFLRLEYTDTPFYRVPRNSFTVTFIEQKGKMMEMKQVWKEKNAEKISLEYSARKNVTTVTRFTPRMIEKRAGMLNLSLYTQNGKIRYDY